MPHTRCQPSPAYRRMLCVPLLLAVASFIVPAASEPMHMGALLDEISAGLKVAETEATRIGKVLNTNSLQNHTTHIDLILRSFINEPNEMPYRYHNNPHLVHLFESYKPTVPESELSKLRQLEGAMSSACKSTKHQNAIVEAFSASLEAVYAYSKFAADMLKSQKPDFEAYVRAELPLFFTLTDAEYTLLFLFSVSIGNTNFPLTEVKQWLEDQVALVEDIRLKCGVVKFLILSSELRVHLNNRMGMAEIADFESCNNVLNVSVTALRNASNADDVNKRVGDLKQAVQQVVVAVMKLVDATTAINIQLCQADVDSRARTFTPHITPIPVFTKGSRSSGNDAVVSKSKLSLRNSVVVVGAVIGGLFLITLMSFAVWFFRRKISGVRNNRSSMIADVSSILSDNEDDVL